MLFSLALTYGSVAANYKDDYDCKLKEGELIITY